MTGRLKIFVIGMTALACVWLGGFLAFAQSLPRAGETAAPPRADAIVVLTGGDLRLQEAIDLLSAGRGERLLISGVDPATRLADLRAHVSDPRGLLDCCVDIDRARDTVGNASETASWARERGYRRLIVVTAGYHMPRSLAELSNALPDADLVPYPVFPDRVRLDDWWRWPGTTRLLMWEYTKYLAALTRLRIADQA